MTEGTSPPPTSHSSRRYPADLRQRIYDVWISDPDYRLFQGCAAELDMSTNTNIAKVLANKASVLRRRL